MNESWTYAPEGYKGNRRKTGFTITDDKGRIVCKCFPNSQPSDPKVKRERGLLIAAAPRLLSALKMMLEVGMTESSVLAAREARDLAERTSK